MLAVVILIIVYCSLFMVYSAQLLRQQTAVATTVLWCNASLMWEEVACKTMKALQKSVRIRFCSMHWET